MWTKSKSRLRVFRSSRDVPAPRAQKVALGPVTLSPTYDPSVMRASTLNPRRVLYRMRTLHHKGSIPKPLQGFPKED